MKPKQPLHTVKLALSEFLCLKAISTGDVCQSEHRQATTMRERDEESISETVGNSWPPRLLCRTGRTVHDESWFEVGHGKEAGQQQFAASWSDHVCYEVCLDLSSSSR